MILLDQTVVAVATPAFQEDYGANLNQVVWVTSIYLLTFAVPLLFTGRLGDKFGQRNVYLVGMAMFTISSLACALAPTVWWLVIARAFQGLGASILTPQTMSVINRLFPRDKRGAALGVWGMVAGLATLAGPILGGFLVAAVGWRSIFLINVPIGVVSFALVWLWVPRMESAASSIDIASVFVSIAGVFALVFGLQQGPHLGWPWWIFVLIAVGLLLGVVFVRLQARVAEPLIPLDIFSNHNFSLGAFSIATMGFAVAASPLPIMLYLQQAQGLSAEKAGLMLVPQALISGALSPFVGRLSDTAHPRTLSVIGFGSMVVGTAGLAVAMHADASYWWLLVPIVILGLGNGFVWSPNSATAMRDMPIPRIGAASGVYNTTRQVGSVLGAAIVGAVMQMGEGSEWLGNALFVTAIVLVLGLISVTRFTSTLAHHQTTAPGKG